MSIMDPIKKSALQPEFLRNARDADLHAGMRLPILSPEPISIAHAAPRPLGRGEGSERALEVADGCLSGRESLELNAAVHFGAILARPQGQVEPPIADADPQVRRCGPAEALRQSEGVDVIVDLSFEGPQ